MKMKKMSKKEEPGCCEAMNPHKMRRAVGAAQKGAYTSSGGTQKMPGGKNLKVNKTKKY